MKMGAWTGNIPQYIYMYTYGSYANGIPFIIFHRGLLRPLYDTFKSSIDITIRDERIAPVTESFNVKGDKKLRSYQEEAVGIALKRAQGIIVSPAGSGKTVIGVEIARQANVKTIWFTHKKELIQQTKERFMEYTDIAEERIGIYGDGKKEIKDITIATVQTLTNMDSDTLDKFTSTFGCIIVDEVHHAAADTWKIIGKFPAKYRIGLTATPVRGDGLTEVPRAVVGKEIYTVDRNLLVDDQCILKSKMYYAVTNCTYPEAILYKLGRKVMNKMAFENLQQTNPELAKKVVSHVDNPVLLRAMSTDAKRNEILVKLADIACQTRDCLLVMTNLVYHTEHMAQLIDARLKQSKLDRPVFVFHAKSDFTIDKLEGLKQFVIVATFGKAEEGLDIPQLDALLLAAPMKGERRLIQTIGRIERNMIGKKSPIVYDVVDQYDNVLVRQWNSRRNLYIKHNMEVDGMDIPEEYLNSI